MLMNGYARLRAPRKPEQRTLQGMFPHAQGTRIHHRWADLEWVVANSRTDHREHCQIQQRGSSDSQRECSTTTGASRHIRACGGVASDVPAAPTPQGGDPATAKPPLPKQAALCNVPSGPP